MKLFSGRLLAGLLIFIATAFSLSATAATVVVGYYSLSPDPVSIKTGDVVYWVDGDDLGPYVITVGTLIFGTPDGVQFNAPGTYHYSADSVYGGGPWSGSVVVTDDAPPTVSITSPTNNSVFMAPAGFAFEADASDPDVNDLSDVEFYVGDTIVDDVYSAPYSTTITNLPAGTYTLTAIAWDYSYETATNSVTITVVNSGPIQLTSPGVVGGNFVFQASGLVAGKTNVLESSSDLVTWLPLQTNVPDATSLSFTNAPASRCQFFRLRQMN
jgi:hypothetical protein